MYFIDHQNYFCEYIIKNGLSYEKTFFHFKTYLKS